MNDIDPIMKKVFKQEFLTLNKHRQIVEDLSLTDEQLRHHYKKLLTDYQYLLQDATKITTIGDLNQKKLFEAFEEMERQKAELRIAAVAFESQEGIMVTDANQLILRTNQAFSRITGYSAAEVIGKKPSLLHSKHHDASFYTQMCTTIQRNGSWEGEIWNQRKNGEIYPAWLTITAVRNHNKNSISHYVATFVDITERKLVEKTMQEAELKATRANQAKREFLANMSHEIRTPMNAIAGMTRLLQNTELSAKQKNYLNKIENSAQSLLYIISDILDFSRIEAGKLQLEQRAFLLDEVFDNLLSVVEFKAQQKGIELVILRNLDNQQYFCGDSVRLAQILINLVGNAIKFTKQGKVVISVSSEIINAQTLQLCFSVQDTGIGMTAKQITNLFQAFSQGDTSTTRKYGGTGLGLSICKKLVEMMQGRIWVESVSSQGSTFFFTVQLKTTQASQLSSDRTYLTQPHSSDVSVCLNGKKILLVDDNEINRELVIELLSELGVVVEIAENGREGVERVLTEPFDLVLMDIQMPEMDGLTATRLIRNDLRLCQLPIIAMTANAMAGDRENSLAAGMNDYLTKPIMPETLMAVLAHWLAHKAPQNPILNHILQQSESSADFNEGFPKHFPPFNIEKALLRVNNNSKLLGKLLLMFSKEYAEAVPKLKQLISEQRHDEAKRLVHTLHTVAASLEATELAKAAAAMEWAFCENKTLTIAMLLESLNETLAPALQAANRLEKIATSAKVTDSTNK